MKTKEQTYYPQHVVTFIYLLIVFDVDISSLTNKIFHYIQLASCFSCYMQRCHLKEKEVSPNELLEDCYK